MTDQSGQPVARASRSRSQAKAPELLMNGTCGPTFIDCSKPEGPLNSWVSRLQERLAMIGSTESPLIWREKATPAGRSIFRLAPWTPPHIRQRQYWAAVADCEGRQRRARDSEGHRTRNNGGQPANCDGIGRLANADSSGRDRRQEAPERSAQQRSAVERIDGDVGNSDGQRCEKALGEPRNSFAPPVQEPANCVERTHGVGGFWSEYEWLACHDGKARRTKPGLPLLAHGIPGRVAKWRGLGNAINPWLAAEVIAALRETLN